eukprot:COSAG01_NODE_487_length_16389_cov_19.482014_11_plen_390_part_00
MPVDTGKMGQTVVEMRLFESSRFHTGTSLASSYDAADDSEGDDEPPVIEDDRDWAPANWDDSDDDSERGSPMTEGRRLLAGDTPAKPSAEVAAEKWWAERQAARHLQRQQARTIPPQLPAPDPEPEVREVVPVASPPRGMAASVAAAWHVGGSAPSTHHLHPPSQRPPRAPSHRPPRGRGRLPRRGPATWAPPRFPGLADLDVPGVSPVAELGAFGSGSSSPAMLRRGIRGRGLVGREEEELLQLAAGAMETTPRGMPLSKVAATAASDTLSSRLGGRGGAAWRVSRGGGSLRLPQLQTSVSSSLAPHTSRAPERRRPLARLRPAPLTDRPAPLSVAPPHGGRSVWSAALYQQEVINICENEVRRNCADVVRAERARPGRMAVVTRGLP